MKVEISDKIMSEIIDLFKTDETYYKTVVETTLKTHLLGIWAMELFVSYKGENQDSKIDGFALKSKELYYLNEQLGTALPVVIFSENTIGFEKLDKELCESILPKQFMYGFIGSTFTVVQEYLTKKYDLNLKGSHHFNICYIVPSMFLNEKLSIQLDTSRYHFGALTDKDVPQLTQEWQYGSGCERTKQYFQDMVNSTLTKIAVRDITDNNLVSYYMHVGFGGLGMLYTNPLHRGKGLGKITTTKLVESMLEKGLKPFCFIEEGFARSMAVHKGTGFSYGGKIHFCICKQK